MKIEYMNTDLSYLFVGDEEPELVNSGKFIKTLSIDLLDRQISHSLEVYDGIVLDFDEDDNVIGIDLYDMDGIMNEKAMKEFDDTVPPEFRKDPDE